MFSKNLLCLVTSIVHLLSHIRALPTRLELWAKGKCSKRLLRNFLFSIGLLKLTWIVARFVTLGTLLESCKGSSKTSTTIDAHVVLPSGDSRKV